MMGLPEKFTYPYAYTPHPLVKEAAEYLISYISSNPELDAKFAEGKMLGVLVVEGGKEACAHEIADGLSVLWGYSGLVGGCSEIEGFVPPILDWARPEGYFRQKEAEISAVNAEIEALAAAAGALGTASARRAALLAQRKEMSEQLQRWLFDNFHVLNGRGEEKSVLDIFAERRIMPPGGTGDCALPKMLQFAYSNGMKPLAFGEFWYGQSPEKEIRRQGSFYPSCTGKCKPLLDFMLQGIEVDANPLSELTRSFTVDDIAGRILFEDDTVIVVDKPSGLQSVPGREDEASLLVLLQRRSNSQPKPAKIYSCHRLDMDTSGVMVFAKTAEAQADIQLQFEHRETSKSYQAVLSASEADLSQKGTIELPLGLDYYDRPRQKVDFEEGKPARTDYEVLEKREDGTVLVRFIPHTGRTHQLRVHAAHPSGLGRPIKGDRLYGGTQHERLCLHAEMLSFRHPITGDNMTFRSTIW